MRKNPSQKSDRINAEGKSQRINGVISGPVVGYARVSTDNQRNDGTIRTQIDALKTFCSLKAELLQIYTDDSVSGELQERTSLATLFEYLEGHTQINCVVIFKLDRIARDLYLQEHLIKKLEALGVTLVSIKEPYLDSNDPMRKAFRQFMGVVSELEKSFITMRMSERRKSKARRGGYAGGRVPFGYKTEEGELRIDGDSYTILKKFYSLRIGKHLSYKSIAA